jgi:hypothetical protein
MKETIHEFIHMFQKARIVPLAVMAFILWLTYDFHIFYKSHALEMKDWQLAAVFAYAGVLIGAIKFLFEHITNKIEKDD